MFHPVADIALGTDVANRLQLPTTPERASDGNTNGKKRSADKKSGDGETVARTSGACRFAVVAGVGFEPTTFRLCV